jgi:hypothetical protein
VKATDAHIPTSGLMSPELPANSNLINWQTKRNLASGIWSLSGSSAYAAGKGIRTAASRLRKIRLKAVASRALRSIPSDASPPNDQPLPNST